MTEHISGGSYPEGSIERLAEDAARRQAETMQPVSFTCEGHTYTLNGGADNAMVQRFGCRESSAVILRHRLRRFDDTKDPSHMIEAIHYWDKVEATEDITKMRNAISLFQALASQQKDSHWDAYLEASRHLLDEANQKIGALTNGMTPEEYVASIERRKAEIESKIEENQRNLRSINLKKSTLSQHVVVEEEAEMAGKALQRVLDRTRDENKGWTRD